MDLIPPWTVVFITYNSHHNIQLLLQWLGQLGLPPSVGKMVN